MTQLNDIPPPEDRGSELEQKSLFGDHKRGEGLKKHIYNIVCASLYVLTIIYSCLIGVWGWHICAPHCWRWLDEIEVHMLERIVFGGAVLTTFATKYFKKYKVI